MILRNISHVFYFNVEIRVRNTLQALLSFFYRLYVFVMLVKHGTGDTDPESELSLKAGAVKNQMFAQANSHGFCNGRRRNLSGSDRVPIADAAAAAAEAYLLLLCY